MKSTIKNQSNSKSSSSGSRETPSAQKSKNVTTPTHSQVALQSQGTTNSMNAQLNLKKNKSGGSVDKRLQNSNSKQQVGKTLIKGQTFNYQEQALVSNEQDSVDGTPNRNLFKKSLSSAHKINSQKQKPSQVDYEDQFIEVRQQDEEEIADKNPKTVSKFSHHDAANRPSDEVQYSELIIDDKDSMTSSVLKSSQAFQIYQSNSKFYPVEESNSLDSSEKGKSIFRRYQQDSKASHMNIEDSGFKVHEESFRGAHELEDRIIKQDDKQKLMQQPHDSTHINNLDYQDTNQDSEYINMKASGSVQESQQQRNSDFKRFDIDEEFQNQQALRVARKHQDDVNEKVNHDYEAESRLQRNDHRKYELNNEDDDEEIEEYQKIEKSVFQQQNQLRNQILESKDTSNQYLSNNSDFNSNTQQQYEQDFKQQQHAAMSPSSFGSPQMSLHIEENSQMRQRDLVLSFADQNKMYLEYPPMQVHNNEDDFNMFKPLSPTGAKQQQRLQDILQTSKGDVSQLQNALSSSKIDEQSLNNMIDMEKNYVIMQYESILQQLNIEFHKLLAKNKDTEESMVLKEQFIKSQSLIIQEKDEQLFQQEQVCRQLKNQVQDLMIDIDHTNNKVNSQRNVASEVESYRLDREVQEQKIHQLQGQVRQYQSVETDLREQLDSLQGRLRHVEQQVRLKEEEAYSMERDKQKYGRDLKNMADIQQQLKDEIKALNTQRIKLEDQLSEEKQKSFQVEISKRQREMEMETLIRDNRSLKGSLEILQQSFNESNSEGNQLKELITENERQKLVFKAQIEKQGKQVKYLQAELGKSQAQVDLNQQELKRQQQHSDVYPYPPPTYNSYRQGGGEYKDEHVEPKQPYNQDHSESYLYKPLKENNAISYYSPQRNQRNQPQQLQFAQSQQSPQNSQNAKNSIIWMSQVGGNDTLRNRQNNFDPQEQQPQRRKTQNQNESQLQGVFQWPTPTQNASAVGTQQVQGHRSLERQKDNQYFQPYQQQPQLGQESVWTKGRSPLAQQQQLSHQNSQTQLEKGGMPYAGKKTVIQMGQSPIHGRGNKNQEQQVLHLQNTLSSLQQDKEMIENEFRRLGGHPKNKSQIEKKQSLEIEVEIVNKNIQNLKQKLRELNAF